MQHNPQFLKLVNDARTRINECNIDHIKYKMDNDVDDFILIDVREESEFSKGYLPNAKHLSKGIIERDIEKIIPNKDKPLFLYCGGGYRSALAADNLQKMGYTNVTSIDGGMRAWKESQYPIVK